MFVLSTIMSYVAALSERKDDRGASAVEYAILVVAVVAAVTAAVAIFRVDLEAKFGSLI